MQKKGIAWVSAMIRTTYFLCKQFNVYLSKLVSLMIYLQQIKNQLCELHWICDLFVLTERLKPWLYWRDLRRTDKSFDLCTLRQCRPKSKWTSLLDISPCKSNKGKWKSILSTKFKNILLISKDGPSHTFDRVHLLCSVCLPWNL